MYDVFCHVRFETTAKHGWQGYTDGFIDVLFTSIATPNVTLEHEYASLLFSISRLGHPLFHELPLGAPGEDGDWHLKKHDFIEKRLAILDGERDEHRTTLLTC